MIAQFKDWYSIEEVAEMFECKVDDIHHFIQADKLKPVLWFENEPGVWDHGEDGKYDIILNGLWACLSSFRHSMNGGRPIVYKIEADDQEKCFTEAFPIIKDSFKEAYEYKNKYQEEAKDAGVKKGFGLHILAHEEGKFLITSSVKRFFGDSKTAKKVILRKELDKFKSIVTLNHSSRTSEILNENHPWYSPELALAIQSWFALYADHEGRKGNNAFKPHGGHPKMIEDWLNDNYSKDTSKAARERIASVVSPCSMTGSGSCPPWHKKNTPKK